MVRSLFRELKAVRGSLKVYSLVVASTGRASFPSYFTDLTAKEEENMPRVMGSSKWNRVP